MPNFDLKDGDGLDRLAVFKVLAVMCFPNDHRERERMVGLVQKQAEESSTRRRPMNEDEFRVAVKLHSRRAGLAGGLVLCLLQLKFNGIKPTLDRAVALVQALLPKWEQESAPLWTPSDHVEHSPHSRRKIMQALEDYRPVAHLWAADLHGRQHNRPEISPSRPATLPTFLAYAEAILNEGSRLRRLSLEPKVAWRFSVAGELPSIRLAGWPLAEAQLRVLDELGESK